MHYWLAAVLLPSAYTYAAAVSVVPAPTRTLSHTPTTTRPTPDIIVGAGDVPVFDDGDMAMLAAGGRTSTKNRHVPPMYSPGTDGMWRRADSYTLVGSTLCDTCTTPTATTTPSDDEVLANVPPGWDHTPVSNPTRTKITIALSVTLACFICLTLARFHFHKSPPPRRSTWRSASWARPPRECRAKTAQAPPIPSRNGWRVRPPAGAITYRYTSDDHPARPPSPAPSTRSASSHASASSFTPSPSASTVTLPLPRARRQSRPMSPSISRVSATPCWDVVSAPAKVHDPDEDEDALAPAEEAFPPYTPRADPDPRDGDGGGRARRDGRQGLARALAERPSAPPPPPASSSAPPPPDADARAPAEDDILEMEMEGLQASSSPSSSASSSSNSNARSRLSLPPPPPSSLPPPPPPPSSLSGVGVGGGEKMALERAYAVREAEAGCAYAYPSAPAYSAPDADEAYPEAGPSTPSVFASASAPPLLDYGVTTMTRRGGERTAVVWGWDEDEDERTATPIPALPPPPREDEGADGDTRHGYRAAQAGEAHDTGWRPPPTPTGASEGGEGQGHDR
ncbi:hypothetical protein K438DRAFT_1757687 [Mycena galopus ATCC 62051]|nr:hypothetical protein K438DRAFT_1757687 [Mycena galopus ATCC 62051]